MIRRFVESDRKGVIDLWSECRLTRPWNDPSRDIDRKMGRDPEGFLVSIDGDEIVGSVMVGYDGHRGWINYLAVRPSHQRRGIAKALMQAAERHLTELDCPKVNLQMRSDNEGATAFYESIGYHPDDVASYGRRLIADV